MVAPGNQRGYRQPLQDGFQWNAVLKDFFENLRVKGAVLDGMSCQIQFDGSRDGGPLHKYKIKEPIVALRVIDQQGGSPFFGKGLVGLPQLSI